MSTDHHTPHAYGARLTSAGINAPLAELDAAITAHGWYDARDFGATGDGSTDDTAAIQAAIDFAATPTISCAYRIGGSGVDYGLRVYAKGVLLGTTSTIAAAASNATIQAALESISGLSGKVTVGATTFGDGGNDAVFSRDLGFVELVSSYIYDYPNGPIIYPRPGSRGPGGVIWVPGLAAISDTVRVYSDGIRIETGRTMPGTYVGASVAALRAGYYSNGLIWSGTDAGGPMVLFRPDGMFALTGVGFSGTLIAGSYPFTTAADTGLQLQGVEGGTFEHVWTVEFKADGVLMTTDIGTRASQLLGWSVAFSRFDFIGGRQWINPGNGLRIEGDGESTGLFAANHYANTIGTTYHYYKKGHGIVMGDCDSHRVENVHGIAFDTTSVTLSTSSDADDIIDTAVAHGFTAGDTVYFVSRTGGSNLSAGTPYYVISANLGASTLQVSDTLGGSAVSFGSDITAGVLTAGVGVLHKATAAGGSRLNHFRQVMCGKGGFILEGTNVATVAPHSIVVEHFYPNTGHHSGPETPTIGTAAEVTWNNLRSSGTDGHGAPPQMVADSFPW